MIPIGTRCIYVGPAGIVNGPLAGKWCEVISHETNPYGSDCQVVFEPGVPKSTGPLGQYDCKFSWLIPIGHDPDTETRTTDREVTA